jgi:hypothetical protein
MLPTRYSPVRRSTIESQASSTAPLDLHVLSTPPAFVLSQDQTLRKFFYFVSLTLSKRKSISEFPKARLWLSVSSGHEFVSHVFFAFKTLPSFCFYCSVFKVQGLSRYFFWLLFLSVTSMYFNMFFGVCQCSFVFLVSFLLLFRFRFCRTALGRLSRPFWNGV